MENLVLEQTIGAPQASAKGPQGHVHKRTLAQRKQDLLRIGELSLQGLGDQEIADRLAEERPYAISRRQVTADLAEVRAGWRESHLGKLADLVAVELVRLAEEESQAWAAWERSKEPRRIVRQTKNGAPLGSPAAVCVTTEQRAGDPRYLFVIVKVRDQRIRMLGLDKGVPQGETVHGSDPERAKQIRAALRTTIEAELRAELAMERKAANSQG